MAIVSHIGTCTHCGHYVAHVLKDGRWVIFNNKKVAISVNISKDSRYLYFLKCEPAWFPDVGGLWRTRKYIRKVFY